MTADQDTFDLVWGALRLGAADPEIDPHETLTPRAVAELRTLPRSPTGHTGETTISLEETEPPGIDVEAVLARVATTPLGPDADLIPLGLLGTGGMGAVYRARQVSLGRDVAIKRLSRQDRHLVEGLLREATVAGSLEHPNVVPVHALGKDEEGSPYLVMKRIEGRKWSDVMREDAPIVGAALDRHLGVLLAVCDALAYAHAHGVLHRDVKLANVMIGDYGEVYLVDWGVATRIGSRTSAPVGTPGYMAPEMVDGGVLTTATDVYLLGATLHHLLLGTPRHSGANAYAVFRAAHVSKPYAYGPEIPEELAAIALKACARDPRDRYPTVRAFQDAVRAAQQHRVSHGAVRAAAEKLTLARSLLADGDARRGREALVAARYGLEEALRAWPENPAGRRNLRRCLELSVPASLQAAEPDAAAEQLAVLETLAPPGTFAALREQVDRAVRKRAALARLGEGLDLSASAEDRQRWLFRLFVLSVGFGAFVIWGYRSGVGDATHGKGIASSILVLFTLGAALGVWRRRVLVNVVDRRIWYTILLGAFATLVHRVLAWWAGQTPFAVWAGDLVILAAMTGVAAIAVSTRLVPLALGLTAAAGLATLFPGATIEILCTCVAASFGALWLGFRRWARERAVVAGPEPE